MFLPLVLAALTSSTFAIPHLTRSVSPNNLFARTTSCSTPVSCHNTTVQTDTCCFETPGGMLLQTQFWDSNPSSGPANSWTIHGLWGDNCDGTFGENCDPSRGYTDISSLLTAQGASDTLAFMETYWVQPAKYGTSESFWEHEWATHGTCYSTLEPSCLPSGSPKGAEAVAFFQTVVALFKTLNTYSFLESAGIVPGSKTYSLSDITSALSAGSGGYTPALTCQSGALNAISWYFNLQGSLINPNFVPIDSPSGVGTSCPDSGVAYPTKVGATSVTTTATSTTSKTTSTTSHKTTTKTTTTKKATTTTTSSSATTAPPTTTTTTATTTASSSTGPTGSALPSSGTITASSIGGLLSSGTWSDQTLATYHYTGTTSSFTMKTSKGSCGVSGSTFLCGSDVTASTFSAIQSGSDLLLAYEGSTEFSCDDTPSGTDQETVYVGSDHSVSVTLAIA